MEGDRLGLEYPPERPSVPLLVGDVKRFGASESVAWPLVTFLAAKEFMGWT